nr:hypothetical protein StreXyl84_77630 [Streptomyces sp. Xyl84]
MSKALKFTGAVRGSLTTGLNSQGVITGEPIPTAGEDKVFAQTSCAEFKVGDDNESVQAWEADVYGKVGGARGQRPSVLGGQGEAGDVQRLQQFPAPRNRLRVLGDSHR